MVQPDLMRDRDNGKNSVLTSQSVTGTLNKVPKLHSSAFVSPKGTVEMNQHEFTTTLNSINAELEGFDSLEESSFSSTKANTHATIIPTSNAQSSEARDHQKTARVPNSTPQRRVLPITCSFRTHRVGEKKSPSIIFLMETKSKDQYLKNCIIFSLKFFFFVQ